MPFGGRSGAGRGTRSGRSGESLGIAIRLWNRGGSEGARDHGEHLKANTTSTAAGEGADGVDVRTNM